MDHPSEDFAVWSEKHRINSFEVDPSQKATVQTLCQTMQEAAWNHAEALKLGYRQMVERGLLWVIVRLRIFIHKYPAWGETVQIRTWPSGLHRLFARRDFQILDGSGGLMAEATSSWLILDERSRRPIRIGPLFAEMKIPVQKSRFEPLEKLPSPQEYQVQPFFSVFFSDLDWYGHVNNVKYMEWILDSYPLEFHTQFQVARFEINFLSETHYGDSVSIRTQRLDGTMPSFLHSLLRKEDDQEVCAARVDWQNNQP